MSIRVYSWLSSEPIPSHPIRKKIRVHTCPFVVSRPDQPPIQPESNLIKPDQTKIETFFLISRSRRTLQVECAVVVFRSVGRQHVRGGGATLVIIHAAKVPKVRFPIELPAGVVGLHLEVGGVVKTKYPAPACAESRLVMGVVLARHQTTQTTMVSVALTDPFAFPTAFGAVLVYRLAGCTFPVTIERRATRYDCEKRQPDNNSRFHLSATCVANPSDLISLQVVYRAMRRAAVHPLARPRSPMRSKAAGRAQGISEPDRRLRFGL